MLVVRLQKFLSDAGVASRRASEAIMLAGRVSVNGETVRLLGAKVDPGRDLVTVDGKPVRLRRKMYFALHKPRGCVCSRKDEHGRATVHELLPKEWGTVHSVGRLDYESEGLLFLTNDGEFSLRLTHPRYGVRKKYEATLDGRIDERALRRLTRGIQDQGQHLSARSARLLHSSRSESVVTLELTEGKNREVRRMFAALGLEVKRLRRVQIGRIKLGELRPGRWRTLTETEIKTLLKDT